MIPRFLCPGDTVGICATARWLTDTQVHSAVTALEGWGFKVKVSAQVTQQDFQLAGSDVIRRQAFQDMLDDQTIQAICVARGGYGTVRILDGLDWRGFLRNPKWVCGYSDITAIHGELNRRGVASIHSTMPVSFSDCTSRALESLREALTGSLSEIKWEAREEFSGEVVGPVTGGNLSVLFSLLGSGSIPDMAGSILFLEDVDEMHYHVDRMIEALKRAGVLRDVRAIIAGGFTQMRDNTRAFGFASDNPWGSDAEQILADHCRALKIPFVIGMPAGHHADNCAFYLGIPATLHQQREVTQLQFQL